MYRPPPYEGQYYHDEKRRGGCSCIRCICCCYCILLLIVIVIAALAVYLYVYFKPKVPTYKFQSFDVKDFGYQPDFSVNADFIITIKAENPNTKIALIYGEASSINVTYSDSTICTGKLPAFHQGPKNTTILQIELKGKSTFGSGLYDALQANEKNGKIPLKVMIKVPVEVVLESLKLRQFIVFVNSTLIVHDLKPGKKPEVENSEPTIQVKF
ncbi:NDR1/HIN1-like protein 6 [Capsicum chacoense]